MRSALLAVVAALAAGCNHASISDGGMPQALDCGALSAGLGVLDVKGDYPTIDTSPEAELILGFQGFKMLFFEVHMSALPADTSGAIVVEIDGESPYSQGFAELQPRDDGKGGLVADPLPLFFNSYTFATLDGKGCQLTLHLGGKSCSATATGHVLLHYSPGCQQDPSGRIECTDGGV